ncbi:MAG TPA: hypothetical protein VLB27_05885, partial [candidate division Zixibacteria bacterium]|nr:hypothetical protein [candidate division Zixibacteria bacterium]
MKRPMPSSFATRILVILALTTPALPCAALTVPTNAADLLAYEEFLKRLESDQVRSAPVEAVSISRAGAVFDLRGGEIHLVSDPYGREVAALYEGSGQFRLDLTSTVEYGQFRRLTQLDSAVFDFERLYIVFSDHTGAELSQHLTFEARDLNDKVKDRWSGLYKLLTNDESKSLSSPLLQGLVNGETRELFYAGFDGPD